WLHLQCVAWQGLPRCGTALQPTEVVKDVFRRTGTPYQPWPSRPTARSPLPSTATICRGPLVSSTSSRAACSIPLKARQDLRAVLADGSSTVTEMHKATGLHDAMYLIPATTPPVGGRPTEVRTGGASGARRGNALNLEA